MSHSLCQCNALTASLQTVNDAAAFALTLVAANRSNITVTDDPLVTEPLGAVTLIVPVVPFQQ